MKKWQEIRKNRTDVSDYLIHCTSDFDTLLKILLCGFLKPTFSLKFSYVGQHTTNTIQGSIPAVCFTEQPLYYFIKSCELKIGCYNPYGVVVHKYALFDYGGRPVIYGDKSQLEGLPENYKFLWVRYNPIPWSSIGYPLDYTHEREWRCIVNPKTQYDITPPSDSIPLLLPWDVKCNNNAYKFRVIVDKTEEVSKLRQTLCEYIVNQNKTGLYWQRLPTLQIIPLDEVREYISKYELKSLRIEEWIAYKK